MLKNKATEQLAAELKEKDKKRVLFVCLGNICRSPAAEGIARAIAEVENVASQFEFDSAGLYSGHAGDLPDSRMRLHARRRGYNLTHRARPVKTSDFEDFDLIVAMDSSNYSRLRAFAPTIDDERKVVMMTDFCRQHPSADHVPDPYYEGSEGFEIVLDLLEDACQSLVDEMKK